MTSGTLSVMHLMEWADMEDRGDISCRYEFTLIHEPRAKLERWEIGLQGLVFAVRAEELQVLLAGLQGKLWGAVGACRLLRCKSCFIPG